MKKIMLILFNIFSIVSFSVDKYEEKKFIDFIKTHEEQNLVVTEKENDKLEYTFNANATEIDLNKIENLELASIVSFINNEINLYKVNNLKAHDNITKLFLDIDYYKGIMDSIIILNEAKGKIIIDLNSIGREKTILKEIPFLIVPSNNNQLELFLNKEEIVDNTIFEIIKEKQENFDIYKLKPHFLDEDIFEKKVEETFFYEEEPNVAIYTENIFSEITVKEKIGKKEYNRSYSNLINGTIIEGKTKPNINIKVLSSFKNLNSTITTKSDDDGNFKTFLPFKTNLYYMIYEYKE